MDILYLVMPAYNEEENIEKTIKDWYPVVKRHNGDGKSRLIVVNDGSTDNTLAKGRALMADMPLFEIVDKPNSGHGPSVFYAYDYSIKAGADWIFQTDSDGQTNPDEFETFWKLRHKYNGIFGKRVERGDGRDRAFVEKVVCFLLRIFFRVNVPDANAPFRLMKVEVLKKYLYRLDPDYNLPNIMMTTYFAFYKEKITFKEITFKPRQGGVNSINIKKIVKIGWKALGDFRKLKKDMKRF